MMSFEDKKGSELVSVQAEKDLKTLVKNDENRGGGPRPHHHDQAR